jgi:isopentenyl-diphosphate delta-isomerase
MASGVNTRVCHLIPATPKILPTDHDPVDYILFIKADVDLEENPNEVQATKYITEDELKTMFKDGSLLFTPWFKLICQSMLFEWWGSLDQGLDKYKGETAIRRML